MRSRAEELAAWASRLEPGDDDLALAERSLRDTLAVIIAAEGHELQPLFSHLGPGGMLAAQAHVLDYDDLHLPSTSHISAVCVPAALVCGGGARAYLAGAQVMARLGSALGWSHYRAGWHATCTAGAPSAAVTAGVALGLDAEGLAAAIALAVPGAGGLQTAFGTAAKSLQVGFAVDAGLRAARLASAGARADPAALDAWFDLVGGEDTGVTTAASSLQPLIHRRPISGLQGKFSLEYGVVAALLDGVPGLDSFTDVAVERPEAQRLMELVEVSTSSDGDGLLAGDVAISIALRTGGSRRTTLDLPPGAPSRSPTKDMLRQKFEACAGEMAAAVGEATFEDAVELLSRSQGGAGSSRRPELPAVLEP